MARYPSLMGLSFTTLAFLCIAFRSTRSSADQPRMIVPAEDSLVNYCAVIEAGYFYGQKFADKVKGLTQEDVEKFNDLWQGVFPHSDFQKGITTREFILGARFGEGNHIPFPPASLYHDDFPDTYLIFHLAKETGMMESTYFSTCPSCKELSIAKINAYLKNTPLRTKITLQFPEIPAKLATQSEAEQLLDALRCMFPDRPVNPKKELSFIALQCADTIFVRSKKELHAWTADGWNTCAGQWETEVHKPLRFAGTRNAYGVKITAIDPCGRHDSCVQIFRINKR